ncbi:hypothetical protein [Streptococcus porci]|uniref:hypothetical protein n=1 Tax=Streptococcus porci TaxID=502567 RepID=UPI0003F53176|nr:hypothetical protein [Streptococcus porci]
MDLPKVTESDNGLFIGDHRIPYVVEGSVFAKREGDVTLVTLTVASSGYSNLLSDDYLSADKQRERAAKDYTFDENLPIIEQDELARKGAI